MIYTFSWISLRFGISQAKSFVFIGVYLFVWSLDMEIKSTTKKAWNERDDDCHFMQHTTHRNVFANIF